MAFGKYELLDRIAAGGMAEIFKARYAPAPGVTKQVVIKKILPHYAANKAFIAMFINEARIAIGLSHGSIAQVFDFGDIDGDYFLAMELVDGPPLSKVIKRAKAIGIHHLPTEFAAFIIIEVLKGLHYAHTRLDEQGRPLKIVHRDVSPQNVLISFEGQIKLVDFGISRARNAGREQAESKGVKGKYAYFAPEQARNKEVDARTDVSSAGIVLYEMLTGELPYQGSMYDVMTRIARGEFVRPRERNAEIHPELERIVLKAMALEKSDRYQSAEAFQHDLSTFLSAQYPSFNSSQLSMLLQLLFEEELVKERRPVQLPPEFVERAQRWKQSANPLGRDDAGWVDESDPEPDGVAEEIATELANMGPDEDDHVETRPLQLPPTISLSEMPKAQPPLDEALERFKLPQVKKSVLVGAGAVLIGLLSVFLVIRLTHGTIDIRSTPVGASVTLDGQRLAQATPVQVPNLRSGRDYHLEIRAPGYQPWVNDVPLKGGQHLAVDAPLQRVTANELKPIEPPPPAPPVEHVSAQQPPSDVVTWPASSFSLDPSRHHIDLEVAGAGSLPLDPRRTYSVSLNKGPTLGWGFYVLNPAGSQAGALGLMPVLISGSSRLFAYRIPSAVLGGPPPEESKPRTLLVKESKGKTKSYTVAPTLQLSDPTGLLAQGLDARASYEVIVHRTINDGTAGSSHVVIGHPTLGLLNTRYEVPVRVTGASRLWFTIIDNPSAPSTERPSVEINDVSRNTRR